MKLTQLVVFEGELWALDEVGRIWRRAYAAEHGFVWIQEKGPK
jgi:hypothetical protein